MDQSAVHGQTALYDQEGDPMIFEGAISTKSAIVNDRRIVRTVYVDKHKRTRDFKYIIRLAESKGIKVFRRERAFIDEIASGKTHGGMICEVEERKYQDVDDLSSSVVFLIDGIEDPFNIGYIMRTLKAFGYRQVIMPKRDYSSMEATIQKSSAGAFDGLDVIIVDDLYTGVMAMKDRYRILSLSRSERAHNIFSYDYGNDDKIIIIGGEKRGIKKEVLALSDDELYIEYPSDFKNALNAASALNVMVTVLETRKYQ